MLGAIVASSLASAFPTIQKWGFFGHRRINRMAVFTLPPEMIVFFKRKIEYITEHAVDPDKRRYASRFEAILSNIITVFTIFAGLAFVIYFVIGASLGSPAAKIPANWIKLKNK